MKLKIKNFGPIQKGEIDLNKRFYVFVGYNNSGKTYMAQLIWELGRVFKQKSVADFGKLEGKDLTEADLATIVGAYSRFLREEELSKMMTIGKDHFVLSDMELEFDGELLEEFTKQTYKMLYSTEEGSLVLEKKEGKNSLTLDGRIPKERREGLCWQLLIESLFSSEKKFFLPANRSFYPSFYKYLFSTSKMELDKINEILLNDNDTEKIKALSKRPYTKAMDELITKMYGLNNEVTIKESYQDLLVRLKEIMGGEIIAKSTEGIAPIEFFLRLQGDKELDMYLASSASNQLTALYLYLKYWADENNNFLIIDEPEENLHPKSQLDLLNILLTFVNRNNNRVLISTHSPLMTDAVNNYMYLCYLKSEGVKLSKEIKEHPLLNTDIDLRLEDFGIYFFDGKTIIPYEFGEYGVAFKDFDIERRRIRDLQSQLTDQIYDHLNP